MLRAVVGKGRATNGRPVGFRQLEADGKDDYKVPRVPLSSQGKRLSLELGRVASSTLKP